MIELTYRQAEALARWARRAREGKLTGWGSSFDDAMNVAESVRKKLEKEEEKELGGKVKIKREPCSVCGKMKVDGVCPDCSETRYIFEEDGSLNRGGR